MTQISTGLRYTNSFNSSPDEGQVARAKVLTEDLLLVVRSEHAKQLARIQEEQAALHAAQMQYAAYSASMVRRLGSSRTYASNTSVQAYGANPAAPGGAPPPPPDQPPPPPPGSAGANNPGAAAAPDASQDPMAAYTAYWYVQFLFHARYLTSYRFGRRRLSLYLPVRPSILLVY